MCYMNNWHWDLANRSSNTSMKYTNEYLKERK